MNSQQLADRLAELAGWSRVMADRGPTFLLWWQNENGDKIFNPNTPGVEVHPVPVGSLDALERWRGEWLPGEWRWGKIDFWGTVDAMLCYGNPMAMGSKYRVLRGRGPDEWTARAAALIAAKESKK